MDWPCNWHVILSFDVLFLSLLVKQRLFFCISLNCQVVKTIFGLLKQLLLTFSPLKEHASTCCFLLPQNVSSGSHSREIPHSLHLWVSKTMFSFLEHYMKRSSTLDSLLLSEVWNKQLAQTSLRYHTCCLFRQPFHVVWQVWWQMV